MKVYELKIKIFLLKEINIKDVSNCVTRFLDMCLGKNEKFLKLHNSKEYKSYSFDQLYPLEKSGIYQKEKVYDFRVRTIDEKLANYLLEELANFSNEDAKGLVAEVKILPKKMIEKIYTLTPVLLKNGGYWKYSLDLTKFEERLKINCLKKYKYFTNEEIDETIPLYTNLIFKNIKPVPIFYKNLTLRGDKLELTIASDEKSQDIAYMLLGVGLLENTARGCGFLTYRNFNF